MKIRQHIPNFISGVEREIAEYSTLEELREIPFVKFHTEMKGHYRLAILEDMLINETHEGTHRLVVGYFLDELPNFLPPSVYKTNHDN